MVQNKKSKWDCKSRVSTDIYRKNFEESRLNFMNQLLGGVKEVKVYNSKDEFIKSFVHTSSKVFFSAKWLGIIGTLPKIILEAF